MRLLLLPLAIALGLGNPPAPEVKVPAACGDRVMGRPFRGARMLCLAASAMALTANALDDPRRAPAASAQLAALIDQALSREARAPFLGTGTTRVGDRELPRSVLYRGLLGMMLVAAQRLDGPSALLDPLAASLARDLEHGFIASYPDGIWPCDHAPAAAFLRLHGDAAGDALVGRLRDALAAGFPTKVDARGRIIDGETRSTPLAFTAAYLLPAEPALARAFAEQLVKRCAVSPARSDRVPLAACREWTDRKHRGDAASGPIVQGYSVGATALAIIATRALPDRDWNAALLQTAELAGGDARVSLEGALLAWGKTARAW
jgi:hypothetical protein